MRATPEMIEAAVTAVSDNVDWVRGLYGLNYDHAQEVMEDAINAALVLLPGEPVAIPDQQAEIERLREENERLKAEQTALTDANHRQAMCIHYTAQRLGPDYSATVDGLPKAAAHVASLLMLAVEALLPFAEAADSYEPPEGDDDQPAWAHDFPIGSLRRARTALAAIKGDSHDQ